MTVVGVLHPGEMGSAVAAALRERGAPVLWASAGRSGATTERAVVARLEDVGEVGELCRRCDVLLSISPSPPPARTVAMLRPGGQLLVNRETRFPHHGNWHVSQVPGSRIALRNGILSAEGRPMGNVAVLGAAVQLLLPDGLEFLEQAIRGRMGAKIAEPNIVAAREGYEQCAHQHTVAADTPYEVKAVAARPPLPPFAVSVTTSRGNRTGSWSVERPQILEACNVCGLCALFCPEGVMRRVDGAMEIDLDYCKGCGICEDVCPVKNAIAMEEVLV